MRDASSTPSERVVQKAGAGVQASTSGQKGRAEIVLRTEESILAAACTLVNGGISLRLAKQSGNVLATAHPQH